MASLVRAARIAGLCYIVIIVLGASQAAFVASAVLAPGDAAATAANISDHELRFRIGVLADTVLYSLVLVLSAALYLLLRVVHQPLAFGALLFRAAEGVVGLIVTLVGGLMPLLLLAQPTEADPAVAASFLELRDSALDIILILIGPGGAAFCYLFLKGRLVPPGLAIWGLFTYVSMLLLGSARLLAPGLPDLVTTVLYAQGGLFEVLFGTWLLVRGVDASRYAGTGASSG